MAGRITAVEAQFLREQAMFHNLMAKHLIDCSNRCQSQELKSLCQDLAQEHNDFFGTINRHIQTPTLS